MGKEEKGFALSVPTIFVWDCSRSHNCWDVFVSSSPLNVGVHDLLTESQ